MPESARGGAFSPAAVLGHELAHREQQLLGSVLPTHGELAEQAGPQRRDSFFAGLDFQEPSMGKKILRAVGRELLAVAPELQSLIPSDTELPIKIFQLGDRVVAVRTDTLDTKVLVEPPPKGWEIKMDSSGRISAVDPKTLDFKILSEPPVTVPARSRVVQATEGSARELLPAEPPQPKPTTFGEDYSVLRTQEGDIVAVGRGKEPGTFTSTVVKESPTRVAERGRARAESRAQRQQAERLIDRLTLASESGERGLVGLRALAARSLGGAVGQLSGDAENRVVRMLTGSEEMTGEELRSLQTDLRTFAIQARALTTGEASSRVSDTERQEALRVAGALEAFTSIEQARGAVSALTRLRIIHDETLAQEQGQPVEFPVATPEQREETLARLREILSEREAEETFFRLSQIYLEGRHGGSAR